MTPKCAIALVRRLRKTASNSVHNAIYRMSIVDDILIPTAALGGVGAAIDFYLGSAGQKRLKARLEEKWYRFHEVNWHNFSEKEAQYYITFLDSLVGKSLLSRRRIIVSLGLGIGLTLLFTLIVIFAGYPFPNPGYKIEAITNCLIDVAIFAISLSITRLSSSLVISFAQTRIIGSALFLFLVLLHYILLAWWRPLVDALFIEDVRWLVSYITLPAGVASLRLSGPSEFFLWPPENSLSPSAIWDHFLSVVDVYRYMNSFWRAPQRAMESGEISAVYVSNAVAVVLAFLANAARLVFALVLLLSMLGRAWLGPIFSTTWARLVESDKPIFTMVFGAVGAIATTVKELVKLL